MHTVTIGCPADFIKVRRLLPNSTVERTIVVDFIKVLRLRPNRVRVRTPVTVGHWT